ncbi:hypothetical protein [Pseudolysinimonas sp.]|uniref:hypothetical protein n=1 Tax=Pseudolysinimonas sp. TaxID=2680009 RepID=UPI003F7F87D3
MYLRDLARGLARRWYILLIGVLLTIPSAIAAFASTPVTYTAQASMVLLPPSASVDKTGNPYLQLDGLAQALEILGQRMSSESERSAIAAEHPGVTYVAGPDTTTSGPILLLSTEAPRASGALRTLTDLRAAAADTLNGLQAQLDVPESSRIRITDVAVDDSPTVSTKSRTQITLIVIAAGVVLTVLVAGVVDRALAARRRRFTGEPSDEDAPPPPVIVAAGEPESAASAAWADDPQAMARQDDPEPADDDPTAPETAEAEADTTESEAVTPARSSGSSGPRLPARRSPGRSRGR